MRAFSYIRFSSPKQRGGDSLRRQVAAAEAYCKLHDLELDSATYRDLGVSAFDKSNLEKGALAAFLAAVQCGKIPAGTTLIIEALDRLTRAEVPAALHLISQLCEAGVRIVTLADEQVYDAESITDTVRIISSVVLLSRAHDESRTKSKRVRAHFKKRLDAGEYVGHTWPAWLQKQGPAHFEPIPERAAVVRQLFDLAAAGHGSVALARRANNEGLPSLSQRKVPGRWHNTNILQLLRNRQVLGEYQPTVAGKGGRLPAGLPVQMFPPIISHALFQRVQALIAFRSKGTRRRSLRYLNVFQGLLLCQCGASLVLKTKSPGGGGKIHRYYICADQPRGLTTCPRYRALDLLKCLLPAVFEHIAHDITLEARISNLRAALEAAQAQAADAAQRLGRLLAVVESGTHAALPTVQARMAELEAEQAAARQHAQELSAALDAAASVLYEGDVIAATSAAIDAVTDAEKQDERVALHARLSSLVEHIWHFGTFAALRLRGERLIRWLPLTVSAATTAVLLSPPVLPPLRPHHRRS
jgi:DNA invertase Pin-like site-specific DNA recombinase